MVALLAIERTFSLYQIGVENYATGESHGLYNNFWLIPGKRDRF